MTSRPDRAAQLEAVQDILRAISESPFDLHAVLSIVVERAVKLCASDNGFIFLPAEEGFFRVAASYGASREAIEYEETHPTAVTPGTIVGRTVIARDVVQFDDIASDPTYTRHEGQAVGGYRSAIGVPILKQGSILGTFGMVRRTVKRYSPDEVALVKTFADQAAIVIDNVRLSSTINRQREELARYLPSTVAELVSSPEGEQLLAGHRREITAVSCDLRDSTAFMESAEPEEVLDVLREYHREMGAIIVAHGGTLEHYAGDGMMIFLNDPQPMPDHAVQAVRMAVAMRDRFAELAERWRRLGFELGLGVGISVGYATLGRIGFEGHYGYAVIGSVANLAARLCSVAEPGQIVISERGLAKIEPAVITRPLGPVELKGFRRPFETYAIEGLREGRTS